VKLLTLHRILVSTSIAFCAYFAWQQIGTWKADGSGRALALAVVSALIAGVLTWYLTNLKRFVRLDPPAERREP
jgi:hypothetical protein